MDKITLWLAIIAVIPVTITSLASLVLAWQGKVTAKNLMDVSRDTHVLVNSNMAVALESYATIARRLAAITEDPQDAEIAKMAESKLRAHMAQQAIVDGMVSDAKEAPRP